MWLVQSWPRQLSLQFYLTLEFCLFVSILRTGDKVFSLLDQSIINFSIGNRRSSYNTTRNKWIIMTWIIIYLCSVIKYLGLYFGIIFKTHDTFFVSRRLITFARFIVVRASDWLGQSTRQNKNFGWATAMWRQVSQTWQLFFF